MAGRSIAVVPFGARSADARSGAWSRQIARRLVDRFAGHPAILLKPVFLVTLPDSAADAGYLIFGSTPDTSLAVQYGASLGTTHALSGVLSVDDDGRRLEISLADVFTRRTVSSFASAYPDGSLQDAEAALARWLAETLDIAVPSGGPPAANEAAYTALLEGLDDEVNATLLRANDPQGADAALDRAVSRHLAALAADPGCTAAEERLLVRAAESLERGDEARWIGTLETLSAILPRSWRAHYLLGELRRQHGDAAGAIVALEHADALHPLGDADALRLALLYRDQAAPRVAAARLRRIGPGSAVYADAQAELGAIAAAAGDLAEAIGATERAIGAGAQDGALYARLAEWHRESGDPAAASAVFRRAGDATPSWELALGHAIWLHQAGDLERARDRYREALATGAPAVAHLNLARVLVATGDHAAATTELLTLLDTERTGEAAAHARRLLLGLRVPALEQRLEAAGRIAVGGPDSELPAAGNELAAIIAAEPELWEAHFGAGLVARRAGDAVAAERAFRQVLELWPEQPDALHELGVALLMADHTNEAVRALDTAARLRPEDAGYLADAGFGQLRAGNLGAARERLTAARALEPADPVTAAYWDELERIELAVGKAAG